MGTRMHGVVALVFALALAGCSPLVTTTPTPTTPTPTAALPADQVVFQVMAGGGLLPPLIYVLESPSLVIHGDGRVVTAQGSTHGTVPAAYEVARIDPMVVATFVAGVETSGLVGAATDFGRPDVTDLDVTMVTVHGEKDPATARAYALYPQFENRLSSLQRANRDALRSLIERARALAGDAARTAFAPDQVTVFELDPGADSLPATVAWPGPEPASFLHPASRSRWVACGVLAGREAGTLYQAALNNPGARWLVSGAQRILAVNPMPGNKECADAG